MSVTPPKSGPSALLVIIIGSALLLAVGAVVVVLTLNLLSPQSSARPEQEEADEEEVTTTELVLEATWANGDPLTDEELALAEELITSRLNGAAITGTTFSVEDDQIHIAFDEDADEDTLDEATDLLEVTYGADFRPVQDVGVCGSGNDYTDYGPDEEVVFCDVDGTAFALGVSEVSGETIVGATTYQQKNGNWGISILFNPEGAADLAELTGRLAVIEDTVENRLAITLNGEVIASPAVNEAIANGSVSITGTYDEAQADALAAQLRFASKGLQLRVESSQLAD